MNKTVPYILLAFIMSGCSADDKSPSMSDEPTPVVLNAWTPAVGSRAVIESGDVFSPAIAGWETASATPVYSAAPTWLTSANVTATLSQQPISLADPQYYNHDASVSTHMLSWFPKGEIKGEIVTFANTDGSVDAMMANPITGTKNDHSGKVLSFSHLTTQLKFKVVADASLPQGTGLKSITVKGVSLPVGFNLTERNASFSETLSLRVPGIVSPTEITGVATLAGTPVMIKPMAGNTRATASK